MAKEKLGVYCAGPLFTPKEAEDMAEIADVLQDAGFSTFLPQRDGIELTVAVGELIHAGLSVSEAERSLKDAIFALDVYEVIECCDALVVNLNGRVPDEGAVVEVALAWLAGKPLVMYKEDARTKFRNGDNPLLEGLGCFECVSKKADIAPKLRQAIQEASDLRRAGLPSRVEQTLDKGRRIASSLREGKKLIDILRGTRHSEAALA
jgi:nucleoside 2-deoxyribosyltransferase